MPDSLPERLSDKMPEGKQEWMSEDTPVLMSAYLQNRVPNHIITYIDIT